MNTKTISPEAREYYEQQNRLSRALSEVNTSRSMRDTGSPWTQRDAVGQEETIWEYIQETEARLALLKSEWAQLYANNRNGKLEAFLEMRQS